MCLEPACDVAQVRPVALAVHRFLSAHGCADKDIIDAEQALVEACNNAILHSGRGDNRRPLAVAAQCNGAGIEVRVTDHTPGFAWPERFPLPAPESESGRGLFLIRSLMDEVSYQTSEAGNTLIMRKRHSSGTWQAGHP